MNDRLSLLPPTAIAHLDEDSIRSTDHVHTFSRISFPSGSSESLPDLQDDDFHRVSKSNTEQRSHRISHLPGDALGCEAQQAGQWDNGDDVHREDDRRAHREKLHDDADGDKDQENIDPARQEDLLPSLVESAHDVIWFGVCLDYGGRGVR